MSLRPPIEVEIEKEANLRDQKRKILQRLKTQQNSITNLEVKPSLSPWLATRLEQEPRKIDVDDFTCDSGTPRIVIQSQGRESKFDDNLMITTPIRQTPRTEDSSVYVPSFQCKSPTRGLLGYNTPLKRDSYESPKLTKKFSKISIPSHESKERQMATGSKIGSELPSIRVDAIDSTTSRQTSGLRRCASFSDITSSNGEDRRQDRSIWSSAENRDFLSVGGGDLRKASSLPSIYDEMSSSNSDSFELTTGFAKHQQERLERDFLRVEETLTKTFSDLRRYLKPS